MITFIALFLFIFGLSVGSFLNVIAIRSIHGGSIFIGSSKCPHCRHKLTALDLIPLLSFLYLAGKCRYCGKKISLQYPLVELTTGILFAFSYLYWFDIGYSIQNTVYSLTFLIFLFFSVSVLIVLFVTDIRDGLLPNTIVLPSIAAAVVFKVLFFVIGAMSLSSLFHDVLSAFMAAFAFFAIVYLSNEKAMGGGDVKLMFLLGIMVGWPSLLVGLFASFLTGAFVAVTLILIGKKRFGQTVPFGPFLTIGGFIALFWGQNILEAYLKTLNI